MRRLKGQAGGIDALIIIAVVVAVAAIIALAMMRMGQSASANTRAQVIATVGSRVMTVEVQVLNGRLNALYLQYWQQGGTPGQPVSGTCYYNGTNGFVESNSSSIQLYTGQSAVCYFSLNNLAYGTQYSYVIYGVDSSGRTIQLARGVFTAGAT
ncbi:hypothetical protein TUZN_0635 [Thermoproteus uzoniensis 768-20]|uniref:Uncharacterized protein n=1 Tax=Thermoproteus uzoniensis (strain 768-20) TaxID=999630 RepID=F2L471_THEU7|nr:hypothetical protein [Thermoproteus uzoniensis]AEA12127.1 hypothetical protein TUZN_0635 [Thermoproteus uzoniensis 768-20]